MIYRQSRHATCIPVCEVKNVEHILRGNRVRWHYRVKVVVWITRDQVKLRVA